MRTLTIEFGPGVNGFDVVDEYGRRCGPLTLGEMIEQVLGIAYQNAARCERYPMMTAEQWDERSAQFAEKYLERAQPEDRVS